LLLQKKEMALKLRKGINSMSLSEEKNLYYSVMSLYALGN
jgi:hypothetical protein